MKEGDLVTAPSYNVITAQVVRIGPTGNLALIKATVLGETISSWVDTSRLLPLAS